jgi:hypothetical protein
MENYLHPLHCRAGILITDNEEKKRAIYLLIKCAKRINEDKGNKIGLKYGEGGSNKMNTNNINNMNEVSWEIRHLKAEAEKYSWLLGEELTHKIIEIMEEKENDVLENLMWFA